MCQIIHCLPPSIASQIFYEALQYFADLTKSEITAKKRQLYSLLVNACVVDKWLDKCEKYLFDTIFQRIDANECKELPLVILASKWLPLSRAYLSYVNRQSAINPYRKETIFHLATQRKTHFLELIASDGYEIGEPDALKNVIHLIKIGMMIENAHTKVTNFNRYDDVCKRFDLNIDVKLLTANQLAVYTEFNRMLSLYKFIRNNRQYEYQCDTIAVRLFAAKYNIIAFLFRFNNGSILSTTSDYHAVRRQLVANEQFNRTINPDASNTASNKISETHLYDQFYAVDLLYELMFLKHYSRNYADLVAFKCVEISHVIDGIDDSCAFIGAIEILFTVLFVRWEHVKSDSFNKSDFSSITTVDESDTFSNDTVELKKPPQPPMTKTGFACSYIVLQHVLNMLSDSMTKHPLSTDGAEIIARFEFMQNEIAAAKWRLSLVDSYYSTISCTPLPKTLKLLLTPCYPQIDSINANTSDDEDDGSIASARTTPVPRRKLRRRSFIRKPTIGNEINPNDSFAHSTEIERRKATAFHVPNVSIIRNIGQMDRRGFMNKMLGSYTDMATICICTGDYAEAKRIIEVG